MFWSALIVKLKSGLHHEGHSICRSLADETGRGGPADRGGGPARRGGGFTLIELLIAIAIVGVLGSAAVLVLNPAELAAQARDGKRTEDLEAVKKAVSMALVDNPSLFSGLDSSRVYVSLPSCSGLPPLDSAYSYVCSANPSNVNGTGWIPISLTGLSALPIDPVNSASGLSYYAFVPDVAGKTFVITSILESEKYLKTFGSKDGGTDPVRLEDGNPSLWSAAMGYLGYWPIDEGSGGTINNIVDPTKNGSFTAPAYVAGKVGSYAAGFDGTGAGSIALPSGILNNLSAFTFSFWFKSASNSMDGLFVFQNSGNSWRLATYGSWFRLRDWNGVITQYDWSGNAPTPNAWTMITITYDGASTRQLRAYWNGQLLSSTPVSIGTVMLGDISLSTLGRDALDSYYKLNGAIDDARILDRAMTAEEVLALYNATR